MAIEFELEESFKQSLVGLYAFDDTTWNNVVAYCKRKVIDYTELKCHQSMDNVNISAFERECFKKATKAEIESYLDNGGDIKNLPNISNGVVQDYKVEDIMLCPLAKSWIHKTKYIYRGI